MRVVSAVVGYLRHGTSYHLLTPTDANKYSTNLPSAFLPELL